MTEHGGATDVGSGGGRIQFLAEIGKSPLVLRGRTWIEDRAELALDPHRCFRSLNCHCYCHHTPPLLGF